MKMFKMSFITLMLLVVALPIAAENNGLDTKFVKERAEAVMFLPSEAGNDGVVVINLNITSDDFFIFGAKNDGMPVFNLRAHKSFIKVSKIGQSYVLECADRRLNQGERFKIIITNRGDNAVVVTINSNCINGKYKSQQDYWCDAIGFHSGGYYGASNPKYDSSLKESFKYFETFMKTKFNNIAN